MVKEAEAHAEEDKKVKEEAEQRNTANSMVSAAERLVKDLADKMSEDDKKKLNEQREELKKAIDENAPLEQIKTYGEGRRFKTSAS